MPRKKSKTKRSLRSRFRSARASHRNSDTAEGKTTKKFTAFKETLIFLFLSIILFWFGSRTSGDYGTVLNYFGYITGVLALMFFIAFLVLLFKRLFK